MKPRNKPVTIKGVILAGGEGTRLRPLTTQTNKHLLPVGMEPMIWHSVKQLVAADVRDILVITSSHHMGDVVGALGSGRQWNCQITYRVQDNPEGIADGLTLAEDFANDHPILLLLADNIFEYSIKPYVEAFRKNPTGARVLLKEVADPTRFGIAEIKNDRIVNITEKPKKPKSAFAVVGCYLYDQTIFTILKDKTKSARGEYEITSINNAYLAQQQLNYSFVQGQWVDAGTFEAYFEANRILFSHHNRVQNCPKNKIFETALIEKIIKHQKTTAHVNLLPEKVKSQKIIHKPAKKNIAGLRHLR